MGANIMRRSLVIGNWKMNGNRASAEALAKGIIAGLGADVGDIAVCVPYVHLSAVGDVAKGKTLLIKHLVLTRAKFLLPC
jgi:triosephosphate isomerase